jgi:hypothetical protein
VGWAALEQVGISGRARRKARMGET